MLALSRCATPKLGRRWSTYTVLGFAGYIAASIFCAVLSSVWDFTIGMRLVSILAPPIAFIVVVTVATAIKGRELIVFYQTTVAGVIAVAVLGHATGGSVWRQLDVAVLGIGVFLVFGRLGCFHVACCHGRLAKRGVVYGDAHVAVGFWKRWKGRPLIPVQLVESAGAAALLVIALSLSDVPGRAATTYETGYALMRFTLELFRGDPVRPFARGLSEAQWFAIGTSAAWAIARPSWWTIAVAAVLLGWGIALVKRRVRRELFLPPHLREIDKLCENILGDPAHARRETRLGVGVSCHMLPDGRIDWIMSSTKHPVWSADAARRIASLLWESHEIVEGRTPGVVHVLVAK
jgi:prolipoprotein diacylglyceryltransferase